MDLLSTQSLTVISNLLMTGIWLVYLHLFFVGHRRKLRPLFVIHHAQGRDPRSLCLFVNMSEEPVHVQCVLAKVRTESGWTDHYITDYSRITPDDRNVQAKLRQGPVQPGGYITLGSFSEIILGTEGADGSDQQLQQALAGFDSLIVCVAVIHGPSPQPVGACREFCIQHGDGEPSVRPRDINTHQLVSRKNRAQIESWIAASLDAAPEDLRLRS